MKMSHGFLVLFLSILVLSGCASSSKKSCASASQNVPVVSTSVVAAQPAVTPAATPVAEPAANEIPAAKRRYVNK